MQLTTPNDNIQVVLGATASTSQLHIIASYNETTGTSVTPAKNVTTTNNLTAVNLVSAPATGSQRSLRYASIFNCDTAQANVTVRTNYGGPLIVNAISTVLQVNEYLQYTYATGWKAFDVNGSLKVYDGSVNINPPITTDFTPSTTTGGTSTVTISTTQCLYMGRAAGAHKNINLQFVIGGATGVGITWAEAAIYKGTPSLGATSSNLTLTRCGSTGTSSPGYVDITPVLTLAANASRGVYIQVSNINAGDDLWFVVGNSATTSATLRANNTVDDIGAGFLYTAGTSRPSASNTISATPSYTGTNLVRFVWMGD